MYLPCYDLLIGSIACNHLYVDVVRLGKSHKDGTNAVPHGVVGNDDAVFLEERKHDPPMMPSVWKTYFKIANVSSLKDLNVTRNWTVELITVPQKHPSILETKEKGKQHFIKSRLS